MNYRYFISYAHGKGFGMTEIGRDVKIETMEDVLGIKKSIEENNKAVGSIVVISWQPFEQKEGEANGG